MGAYWWPFLCQPGWAVEGVAGLQDSSFGRVQALPLLSGSDGSLHIFLHTRHWATLDATATGDGAGCPRTALPSDIAKGYMKWLILDFRICAVSPFNLAVVEYIPRQRVVEVIWHNVLVAVTKRQNQLRKCAFKIIQTAADRSIKYTKCLYL